MKPTKKEKKVKAVDRMKAKKKRVQNQSLQRTKKKVVPEKHYYQALEYLKTGTVDVTIAATTFGLDIHQFGRWLKSQNKKLFNKHFEAY